LLRLQGPQYRWRQCLASIPLNRAHQGLNICRRLCLAGIRLYRVHQGLNTRSRRTSHGRGIRGNSARNIHSGINNSLYLGPGSNIAIDRVCGYICTLSRYCKLRHSLHLSRAFILHCKGCRNSGRRRQRLGFLI
jgi:hypothetical protein